MSAPHKVTWWAYAWSSEGTRFMTPRRRHMTKREGWIAWDATCACGWHTRTGGAIEAYITRQVRSHKAEGCAA